MAVLGPMMRGIVLGFLMKFLSPVIGGKLHISSANDALELSQKLAEKFAAGTPLTDEEKDAISKIKSYISQLLTDLQTQRDRNQGELNLLVQEVANCGVQLLSSMEIVNHFKESLPPARTAHAECRSGEVELENTKSTACSAYDAYRSTPPGNSPPACMNGLRSADMVTTDAAKKQAMEQCIVAIEKWVDPLIVQYKNCHTKSTEHETHQGNCNVKQGDFESDFCQWSVALSTTCWGQAQCRNNTIANLNQGAEQLVKAEEARETDCKLGHKVDCLLGIFSVEEDDARKAKLQECKDLTPTCPEKIASPPIPNPEPCGLPEHQPCEEAFLEAE